MGNERCPPCTTTAVEYAWHQLAQRAGIRNVYQKGAGCEELSVTVHCGEPTTVELVKPGLLVVPCRVDAWERPLDQPSNSLDWLPSGEVLHPGGIMPVDASVPVFVQGTGGESDQKPFAEHTEEK